MSDLRFEAVTTRNVDDFVFMFDRGGWQRQCWCMVWRATETERPDTTREGRRARMMERIEGGVPVGLLGYQDDEPVAWVSIAPKLTYQRLGGPEPEPDENVWSLVCMVVRIERRGEGLAHQLIAAAVDHARNQGASAVEAYPVEPDSPSYTYMGFVPAFETADFVEVGRVGIRRHVMRRTL